MKTINEILLSNRAWAREMRERRADYFDRQTGGQNPEILWIGCSDSRVSPEQITQTRPGEMFIHRNIANVINFGDANFLSVLQFAVETLKVSHIVLCGHLGCGGVAAALKGGTSGPIDGWLSAPRALAAEHAAELRGIEDEADRVNRLVELNVREQVARLAELDTVKAALNSSREFIVHGWVYDMRCGIVSELLRIDNLAQLDALDTPPKVISTAEAVEREIAIAAV